MSTGAIIAILGIIIGLTLLIVGIVYLAINQSNHKTQPWWVWFLIIAGSVLLLLSAIFLVFALRGGYGDKKQVQQMPPTQTYQYTAMM